MQAHNKVRAVSYPWGGAFINVGQKKVIIWESYPTENISNEKIGSFIKINSDPFYIGSDKKLLHVKTINQIGLDEYKPIKGDAILKELNIN